MTMPELLRLGELAEMREADRREMRAKYEAGDFSKLSEDELAMCRAQEKFDTLCKRYREG